MTILCSLGVQKFSTDVFPKKKKKTRTIAFFVWDKGTYKEILYKEAKGVLFLYMLLY